MEVKSGKLLQTFDGHSYWITSASSSSDGKFIASGSYDKSVRYWRVKDGIMMWSRGEKADFYITGAIINGVQGVDRQALVAYGAKKPV